MTQLPPGQRKLSRFPRFGGPSRPPIVPENPTLEITGARHEPLAVPVSELSNLPRTEQISDFHCVAGWSVIGLRWEGVAFATFYRSIIQPLLSPAAPVTHVVFRGLDGYRAAMCIEDAMQADVVLADRLNHEPLSLEHGAPLRLVSPRQYGYLNPKHLRAIEIHTSAPRMPRDPILFRRDPRARVWEEERNGVIPTKVVRPVYRLLAPAFMWLSDRRDWT